METINQAATVVKNTIWGEDATNNATTTSGRGGEHSEYHKSMIDDHVTEAKFTGRFESDPDAEGAYQPGDTDRQPQGPISTGGKPQGSNVTGDNQGTNKDSHSSSNEPNTGFGGPGSGAEPSVSSDPSSAPQPTHHQHQGGDRPNVSPDTASSQKSGRIPSPSQSTGSGSSSGGGSGGPGGPGGPGGMKLPDSDNQSKGEGTGEKYERSTGLAVDGGDFDATRPGAAREAARLMDEKGIKHGEKDGQPGEPPKEKKWYGVDHSGFGGHGSHTNKRRPSKPQAIDDADETEQKTEHAQKTEQTHNLNVDDNDEHTEKKGLKQKIKEKLHHGKSSADHE
ncbi:hypothetical protein Dda_2710 [Drechslerella dactyloides]|uniref:Uncharacterized protein n=1 Tax=Drechslerella dactyloides TaxID=74499 RepID=A0AAD6NJM7_DREDA|nr:hypothetical protein Dda_2710 [Drechslerella dactyloides]